MKDALANFLSKEITKWLAVVMVIAALIGCLIGYALAFPITWNYEDNPLVKPDGFRLYRHAGPCTDPVKQWKQINSYPPDVRSGEATAPKPPAMRCYSLRAYKKYDSGIVESDDSNLVQRQPDAAIGLKEVKP